MRIAQDLLSHSCFSSVQDNCGYFVLHLNLKYKYKQNARVVLLWPSFNFVWFPIERRTIAPFKKGFIMRTLLGTVKA